MKQEGHKKVSGRGIEVYQVRVFELRATIHGIVHIEHISEHQAKIFKVN